MVCIALWGFVKDYFRGDMKGKNAAENTAYDEWYYGEKTMDVKQSKVKVG